MSVFESCVTDTLILVPIVPLMVNRDICSIFRAIRCASWVSHAMYGATQSMRGASREVEFVPRSNLVELLARSRSLGGNKLYILVDEQDTEGERSFMERSILFGFDAMTDWQSRNAGMSPRRDEWQRNFMAMCLDYEAI